MYTARHAETPILIDRLRSTLAQEIADTYADEPTSLRGIGELVMTGPTVKGTTASLRRAFFVYDSLPFLTRADAFQALETHMEARGCTVFSRGAKGGTIAVVIACASEEALEGDMAEAARYVAAAVLPRERSNFSAFDFDHAERVTVSMHASH